MIPMRYSEARGTLIYEKKLKSKISCQTPFKIVPKTASEFLFRLLLFCLWSVLSYVQSALGTFLRITGGFRNNFMSNRRLTENPEQAS
jgi:hypothetical protein